MKCVISGGTGFIGRRIVDRFRAAGHSVDSWSRKSLATFHWDPLTGEPSLESLEGMDAVLHLAGEPVAQRWNGAVKQRIRDSRVFGTRRLVDAIAKVSNRPRLLVAASAIGIYGDRGDEILNESSGPGAGFLAEVCRAWEAEAERAAQFGLRVVKLRIGFVLGKDGGALGQMLPVFRLGLGGPLGSGKQWMPWIHADDVAGLFLHAATTGISGVWNATAPNPVTNADFTRALAKAIHRPAIFPVPPFALKLLFGELAQHMLDSARVVPEAALKAGFRFRFPEIGGALEDLLG
ncbi:MAG TPA: TIGR01777 family oxidoreductase [Bryobacteraceae bacterium]|nr:TIGR01777 family oxidoreductase [Bryobacteraceae bacterium]